MAWDGAGLHHQPLAVQSLFANIWGTADDLHVRTWAWQHNCRAQRRNVDPDGGVKVVRDGNPPPPKAQAAVQSSSQPQYLIDLGEGVEQRGQLVACNGSTMPSLTPDEILAGHT